MRFSRPMPGFTLVELLVVLGIVTLASGVVGLALREGEPARGLDTAQTIVASLLVVARDQAVAHRNRAQLVFDADPTTEHFLRRVHVAVESAPNSGQWWIAAENADLPRGVFVVPGTESVSGVTYVVENLPAGWPQTRRSSLAPVASVAPEPDFPSGNYLGMIAPLTAEGLSGAGGGDKFVFAMGRRTLSGVVFEHPDQVCGITLSSCGMAILLNDGSGFDF